MTGIGLGHHRFVLIFLGLGCIVLAAGVGLLGWWPDSQAWATPAGDAEAGKLVYEERCAGCHGLKGDGDGPAAALLYPRPRDFRRGLYKVRATPSGALPRDEDLFHIISDGMPGTSMPGWREVLTEQRRRDIIAYIKTFSRRFGREQPPQSLTLGKPIPSRAESIAKGKELYFGPLECFKCHGQKGRGDGPSALEQEDDFGFPILPATLTKSWNFRGGDTPQDIARTFLTGLGGTPMPSYEGQMTEEESWHLANFVHSLAPAQRPEVKGVLLARRVEGPVPLSPQDPQWGQAQAFFYPLVGQIIQEPRHFTPALDAVTVRALYNEEYIAVLLTWDDRSPDREAKAGKTVDALAVQFPVSIPQGFERPFFLEGDPGHPVNLWRWQADIATLSELNADGLGTAQPQDKASQALEGQAVYQDGQWQVMIRRKLTTADRENDIQFETGRFIPIAFSAWDGHNEESGGKRAVSTWYLLYLESPPMATQWLRIPGAVAASVGLEVGLLWWVRRRRARS